jgi:hypothetical protein
VLFQKSFGLLRRAVHDHPARLDGDGVGGIKLDLVARSIYERARDVARSHAGTEAFERSRHDRKRIEMRFAHLKRILRLGRLRIRGPRAAQDEFVLAATAQNLRQMARLITHPPPFASQHGAPA